MTAAREEVSDFTFPVMLDYWTILMPVIVQPRPWAIFEPFDLQTWAIVAFTVAVFSLSVYFSLRVFYGSGSGLRVCGFVARTVLAEPVVWSPQERDFEKVFSTAFMVMMFVLLQAYAGALMSLFAAPSFPIPINR